MTSFEELVARIQQAAAAASPNPEIQQLLVATWWEVYVIPRLPDLDLLDAVSLDQPRGDDGQALIDQLRAAPLDEPAQRARVLEERAALSVLLDEVQRRAAFSRQELTLWVLTRYEGLSLGQAATAMGRSLGTIHSLNARMKRKASAVGAAL